MFTLSRDTIMWEIREFESTINLIFIFENMTSRLEHCKSRVNIKQSFDHISIFIRLCLDFESILIIRKRAWKLLNMKKLRAVEKHALWSRTFCNESEIDFYIEKIQQFLHNIIECSILWVKSYSNSKSYWSQQYSDAIHQIKRFRRI